MASQSSTTVPVWVAIDVAKASHQVLIELPGGQRRAMREDGNPITQTRIGIRPRHIPQRGGAHVYDG